MSPESDSDRSKEVGPAVGRSAGEVGGICCCCRPEKAVYAVYSAGTVRLRLTISISGAGGGREVVQGAALNSHHSQAGRVAARFVAWLAAWWVGGLVGWL